MSASNTRPVLYMDFDGVLNFEASRSAYRKFAGGMAYLHRSSVYVPGYPYPFPVQFSGELVRKLAAVAADWLWLTTWRSHAPAILDGLLDITSTGYLPWRDRHMHDDSHVGKWDALVEDQKSNPRPFVWVDDIAVDFYNDAEMIADVPHLLIKPDPMYGMTRDDLVSVLEFVERYGVA